jgi:hypothetical protein
VKDHEPVATTFFSQDHVRPQQSHAVLADAVRERDADAARAAYRPAHVVAKRNVILIVVDALRLDRASNPVLMPRLHARVASGQLQALHGMTSICAESACGILGLMRSHFLFEQTPRDFTLYEALQRNGYRIEHLLSADHTNFYDLKKAYGAFDLYLDGSDSHGHANDDQFLLEQVAGLPSWDGRPVLIQPHLMSCHPLGTRHEQPLQPAAPYATALRRFSGTDAEQRRLAANYYDNGVLQADKVIQDLLATLGRKGYLDDALVIVTADHGELLGEHGQYLHAGMPYEPVLRIPFFIGQIGKANGPLPAGDPATAASVDIAPTVLANLGLPLPEGWSGSSLQQPLRRSLRPFQEGVRVGVYDFAVPPHQYKYWRDARSGEETVVDLVTDPGEAVNLLNQAPPERLRTWRAQVLNASAITLR